MFTRRKKILGKQQEFEKRVQIESNRHKIQNNVHSPVTSLGILQYQKE